MKFQDFAVKRFVLYEDAADSFISFGKAEILPGPPSAATELVEIFYSFKMFFALKVLLGPLNLWRLRAKNHNARPRPLFFRVGSTVEPICAHSHADRKRVPHSSEVEAANS